MAVKVSNETLSPTNKSMKQTWGNTNKSETQIEPNDCKLSFSRKTTNILFIDFKFQLKTVHKQAQCVYKRLDNHLESH